MSEPSTNPHGHRARVLIIYRFLPHYRREFYCRLRETLGRQGVELDLTYGRSNSEKGDEVTLKWAQFRKNWTLELFGIELVWQPCLLEACKYDLVVVEQANRLLINYLLMVLRRAMGFRLAFWGHGLNLQSRPGSLVNRFKILFLGCVDWWFAYTEGVKSFLTDHGFPAGKITVVQNSIDLRRFERHLEGVTPEELLKLREDWGASGPIGLFCGGLYREKRLDFLVQCCDQIRARLPEFHMFFIGAGKEQDVVEYACRQRDWMHYLGPLFEEDLAKYFSLGDVLLMPGLVGLVVLDSFAARCPMVTTHYPFHSPEIEYLENGVNGLVVSDRDYVESVISLLSDETELEHLREGCLKSSQEFSLGAMVDNFSSGILGSLGLKAE